MLIIDTQSYKYIIIGVVATLLCNRGKLLNKFLEGFAQDVSQAGELASGYDTR